VSGWSEHALHELRRGGYRGGGARAAVIRHLGGQDCCRSAQEVFDELRAGGTSIGIASVYRSLELLADLGLVHRIDLGGGVSRFEPAYPDGEHHHHVVCEDCGRVEQFEDRRLEAALTGVADRLGFELAGHDVVLRGACAGCRDE
jgi:Fur family transcriptional regulator, ferric uptake regulator